MVGTALYHRFRERIFARVSVTALLQRSIPSGALGAAEALLPLVHSSGLVGALADIIADLTPDLAGPGVQRPAAPGCGTAPRARHGPRDGEEPGSEGGGEKFGRVQSSCG
jgi:hypothetical protein